MDHQWSAVRILANLCHLSQSSGCDLTLTPDPNCDPNSHVTQTPTLTQTLTPKPNSYPNSTCDPNPDPDPDPVSVRYAG